MLTKTCALMLIWQKLHWGSMESERVIIMYMKTWVIFFYFLSMTFGEGQDGQGVVPSCWLDNSEKGSHYTLSINYIMRFLNKKIKF